ncbi:MAG: spore maturation protein [Bacillota bacterium]|nr:spore maturation protein [Bacillota bacterium]
MRHLLNAIWLFLIVVGVAAAAAHGRTDLLTAEVFASAERAVTYTLEMVGAMCLWLGILRIGEKAGLLQLLARGVCRLLGPLFPGIPRGDPVLGTMAMNLSANILGVGSAATPFGLAAMSRLQELNPRPREASAAMCTFLALNSSVLLLVPSALLAVRSACRSEAPAAVVPVIALVSGISWVSCMLLDAFIRWRSRGR